MDHNFRSRISHMGKGAPFLLARRFVELVFGLLIFSILANSLTKDQFANALRAHKDAHDEMKSSHRKEVKYEEMNLRS